MVSLFPILYDHSDANEDDDSRGTIFINYLGSDYFRLIGLYEAIPRIGMALPAGYFVERMDKKKALLLVVGSYLILTTCLYLCMTILKNNPTAIRHSIYIIVFLMGLVGSMGASASVSLFSTNHPERSDSQIFRH